MNGFIKGLLSGTVAFGAGFAVLSVLVPVQPSSQLPSRPDPVTQTPPPVPAPPLAPPLASESGGGASLARDTRPASDPVAGADRDTALDLAAELAAALRPARTDDSPDTSETGDTTADGTTATAPQPVPDTAAAPEPAEIPPAPAPAPAATTAQDQPAPAPDQAPPALAMPQPDLTAPDSAPQPARSVASAPPLPLVQMMPRWTPPSEAEMALLLPPDDAPPAPQQVLPVPAAEPDTAPPDSSDPGLPGPDAPDPDTPATDAPAADAAPQPAPAEPAPVAPAPQTDPAPRPVVRAVPGIAPTERVVEGVVTGRLPSIGQPATDAAPAPDALADPADLPAWQRHAAAAPLSGLPLFGVVLIDAPQAEAALLALPFAVSLALDPADPDAARRAAAYRAAGHEVLILAEGLPAQAQPADIEVTFAAWLATLPESVAVIDPPEGALAGSRVLAQAVMPHLLADGHGLVTLSRGLNPALQAARAAGVPAASLFRLIDGGDESRVTIRRFLDRALFEAQQQGRVAVLGRAAHGETLAALVAWRMELRAGQADVVPISALLE